MNETFKKFISRTPNSPRKCNNLNSTQKSSPSKFTNWTTVNSSTRKRMSTWRISSDSLRNLAILEDLRRVLEALSSRPPPHTILSIKDNLPWKTKRVNCSITLIWRICSREEIHTRSLSCNKGTQWCCLIWEVVMQSPMLITSISMRRI